jgi:cell wall-associated NlpC family hydrolase
MNPSDGDHQTGDQVAKAALDLVGAPFRLHGRNPETGLDCIGVALAALAAAGRTLDPPDDYSLRGGSVAMFDHWAALGGLVDMGADSVPAKGDVLLCVPAWRQFHVMIDAGTALVHAHIGLRRVVAIPVPPPWSPIRRWRLIRKA